MKNQLPNIYTYFDFRKYLEDYRSMRKEFEPGFTHTYICFRLGQRNSKSYYANVVKGAKTVTPEFTNRFIDLLELNKDEAHYFRLLVNYTQTFNPKEKEYYLQQLICKNATLCRLLTEQEFDFYKEWYHSAIRAILDVFDFKDDFKALAAKVFPPISISDAKQSITLLTSLGLIQLNSQGFYKPTDKTIKTDEFIHNELIRHYQLQCLEVAKTVILSSPAAYHDISTNIISISGEGLKKLQEKVQQFREEIRSLVQNDLEPADRVYQLDIQFFPNSRSPAD